MSPKQSLIDYTLHLADNALILGHRNSEWTGHGPVLEQDIAISNIALDLIGQSRNLYQYAARKISGALQSAIYGVDPADMTEDLLAYRRDAWDFKNCLLVEQPNGDWAKTILRQFFFSNYQLCLYGKLQSGKDAELAAIGETAYKEVVYHLRWSSEWVIRLGDGTEESHARMEKAIGELWKFTGELFQGAPYELLLAKEGLAVDPALLQGQWEEKTKEIFSAAGLSLPVGTWMQSGGKEGRHTEGLGYLLAEMQFLQRAYPGCEW